MYRLISFSGLDGAGKTTQISLLIDFLRRHSVASSCMAMYDDVSIAARVRRLAQRPKAGSEGRHRRPPGGARAAAGGLRLDKNRTDLPTVVGRQVVYLADLAHFLLLRRRRFRDSDTVLVMDRYFFDSLANLLSATPRTAVYVTAFMRIAPVPDLPILLDVRPEVAFQRKAEYPLDYLRTRGEAYRRIFARVEGALIVDAEKDPQQIHQQIASRLEPLLEGLGGDR